MNNLTSLLFTHGLLIATHNQGKLREIQQLLAPLGINCMSAAEKGLPEPVEDGDSFEENAMIKSVAAVRDGGMPALADDSGLVVPALDGDPGIYSARWAGPRKDFEYAMKSVGIALEAKDKPLDSAAYFVCTLSLAIPGAIAIHLPGDSKEHRFSTKLVGDITCMNVEGRVYGKLHFPPSGEGGFGYDPIFQPDGFEQTFGQLAQTEKQKISHRANAFKGLLKIIEG